MDPLLSVGTIFNILLGILFFFFWLFVFVILYHLTRFGVGVQPKRLAALFFFGSILLFSASVIFYTRLDLSSLVKFI